MEAEAGAQCDYRHHFDYHFFVLSEVEHLELTKKVLHEGLLVTETKLFLLLGVACPVCKRASACVKIGWHFLWR